MAEKPTMISSAALWDVQNLPWRESFIQGDPVDESDGVRANISVLTGNREERISAPHGIGSRVRAQSSPSREATPGLWDAQHHTGVVDRIAGETVHAQELARINIEAPGDAVRKFAFLQGIACGQSRCGRGGNYRGGSWLKLLGRRLNDPFSGRRDSASALDRCTWRDLRGGTPVVSPWVAIAVWVANR